MTNAIKLTPTNRRDDDVKYPHIWIPFHGPTLGTGDDTPTQAYDRAYENTNGQDTALFTNGLLTVEGTTTNIWTTNPGVYTSNGDGTNYLQDISAAIKAFCLPANISGLLINFTLNITAAPSAAEYVLGYSDIDSTTGGFSISIPTNGKVVASAREAGGGATLNIAASDDAIPTGVSIHNTVYIDWANLNGQLYEDGLIQTGSSNAIPTPLPTLNIVHGLVIGARSQGVVGSQLNKSGSDALLSNLQIFSCTSDESGNIGIIAGEYHKNPNAIPRTLTNV